jgi:hypothetical protein
MDVYVGEVEKSNLITEILCNLMLGRKRRRR